MLFKHSGPLELAADARMGNLCLVQRGQVNVLSEERRASGGASLAGDDIHHGGLAGAVGADDAAQFAHSDIKRQVVQGLESVETDRDAVQLQNGNRTSVW